MYSETLVFAQFMAYYQWKAFRRCVACYREEYKAQHSFCFVLVAIIVKEQELDLSLYTFLQILSVTLFEKVDILQLVTAANYTFAGGLVANHLK